MPSCPSLGLTVFVNTLRSRASWGVGDLADVEDLAVALGDIGFDYLFLGPTGACPPSGPVPASPYSPQSRQAGSILHVRPERVDGWMSLSLRERQRLRRQGDRLNERPLVDLPAARDLKLRALRAVFARNETQIVHDSDFGAFRRCRGGNLDRLSLYFAAYVHFGPDWRRWPAAVVPDPWMGIPRREELFFSWCEWQLDKQLARASSSGVRLVTDLPVATPALSADAWLWRSAMLAHLQIGSPPDYFNPDGHRWGLVPVAPTFLEQQGFRPLLDPLQHALRHAHGVRIDHAFGLIRLYCMDAVSGKAPFWLSLPEQTVSRVAAYARNTGRFIVTEELGQTPPEAEARFREQGFRKLVPLISDQFDPASPPEVISVTCHDLPTLAGCLHGQVDAPVLDPNFRVRAAARILELVPDAQRLSPGDACVAVNRALAATATGIVVTAPEDILGSRRPINLPGVPESAWPSFAHRLPAFDEWIDTGSMRALVAEVKAPRVRQLDAAGA